MTEMTERPIVVAVAGDPGGANALGAVLETLRADGRVDVRARAYLHACAVWTRRGLSFETVSGETEPNLPDGTSLVLTGTSFNGIDLEKRYLTAARAARIPSLAVLDYWANYRERFTTADGALSALPDLVAVMDEQARRDMIAVGFPPQRLVVTGQPAFDELARFRADFTPDRREAVRRSLDLGPDETLVLFLSQPFSEYYGVDDSHPGFAGFDERSVLAALLRGLENAAADAGKKITLLIRPHPRENPANFDSFRSESVRLLVSAVGEARELVLSVDLVTGMNTILLVEACHLGCIVASLQPGLRGPDPLPTNRQGLSRPVYRAEEIAPVIRELLFDSETRRTAEETIARFHPTGDASRSVAELAYGLLTPSLS